MNLETVNKWLTLLANLGVLAGIVFLSLEISQSNRIAIQDARSDLTDRQHDVQSVFLQDPDVAAVMVKLSSGQPLSAEEQFRATSYAWMLLNDAAALNLSYENGFISDGVLQRYMNVQSRTIERIPGIAPYLEQVLDDTGLARRGVSPVFDNLLDAVEEEQPAEAR